MTDLRRLRLRVLAAITVLATAVISFSSVQHLAIVAGFGWLAWLFPVTLDAVAAFAMDVWMRRSAAQSGAAVLALSAVALSLAANVADHYLATRLVLSAVLGAVPPMMLAALLLVLHAHGRGTKPVLRREPDGAVVPVPPVTEPVPDKRYPGPVPRPMTRYPVPPEPEPEPGSVPPVLPAGPAVPISLDKYQPMSPGTGKHTSGPGTGSGPKTAVPETAAEQTAVLHSIGTKATGTARSAKVSAVPAGPDSPSPDDTALADKARSAGFTTKNAIMTEYHVGSRRALRIARLIKEA